MDLKARHPVREPVTTRPGPVSPNDSIEQNSRFAHRLSGCASMHTKDQIFAAPIARLGDFCFDEQVVDVFPDMIQRSVPGYSNIISAIGMMAARYAQPQSRLYDLGCSLGAATQAMRRHVTQPGCHITAVDLSHPMIERARAHLSGFKSEVPVELVEADICDIAIENASVVVLNFTLQFVEPEKRAALIQRIFDGLRPGGILILSEKFQIGRAHV